MKILAMCFLFLALAGCSKKMYTTKSVPPEFPLTDTAASIIIIDNSTVNSSGIIGIRKKENIVKEIRKRFFTQLVNHMQVELHTNVLLDSNIEINDEKIKMLMHQSHALYVLAFHSFNEGFDRDRIEKEKDNSGTVTKKAYYSIYCSTNMDVYGSTGKSISKQVEARTDHSDAVIAGALLDPGPSFEDNKKSLTDIALLNITKTVGLFKERQISIRVK